MAWVGTQGMDPRVPGFLEEQHLGQVNGGRMKHIPRGEDQQGQRGDLVNQCDLTLLQV